MKIFLVVFLFVILGGLLVYQNFYTDPENNDNNIGVDSPVRIGGNAIYIAEQLPGSFVVINLAVLDKPGYVIIYTDNRGLPGDIIGGTKLLERGEYKNIVANLNKSVINGDELFAIIHEETGDGIFAPNLDTPSVDNDGNVTFMKFKINQNAAEAGEVIL